MKCFSAILLPLFLIVLSARAAGAQAPPAKRSQPSAARKAPAPSRAEEAATAEFWDLARRAEAVIDSNPKEAAALYRQALAKRPSWAEGWFYLGGALYQVQQYSEARDAFKKGLPLQEKNGMAWGFLGLCEAELGEYDQAVADISKGEALGLGANRQFEAAVRVKAAFVLIRQSAFDEAVAHLLPLAKTNNESLPAVLAAGLCALTIPKTPEQLSAEERPVVELAGKATWASVARRPADALFQQLITTYPEFPGVRYAYGIYLMEVDQNQALAEFQRELKANPVHWPSMLVCSFLELRRGAPETAIDLAQRALKIVPERHRWIAQTALGDALLSMGESAKAIPELEAAVKAHPENAPVHFYLEKAYRQAGRKEDAQRARAAFLRLKAQEDPLAIPSLAGMGATREVR